MAKRGRPRKGGAVQRGVAASEVVIEGSAGLRPGDLGKLQNPIVVCPESSIRLGCAESWDEDEGSLIENEVIVEKVIRDFKCPGNMTECCNVVLVMRLVRLYSQLTCCFPVAIMLFTFLVEILPICGLSFKQEMSQMTRPSVEVIEGQHVLLDKLIDNQVGWSQASLIRLMHQLLLFSMKVKQSYQIPILKSNPGFNLP
ncbi:hypothetical protein Dimus_021588, partial [Dionaea muscipula]